MEKDRTPEEEVRRRVGWYSQQSSDVVTGNTMLFCILTTDIPTSLSLECECMWVRAGTVGDRDNYNKYIVWLQ